jgi:hypothetical protein
MAGGGLPPILFRTLTPHRRRERADAREIRQFLSIASRRENHKQILAKSADLFYVCSAIYEGGLCQLSCSVEVISRRAGRHPINHGCRRARVEGEAKGWPSISGAAAFLRRQGGAERLEGRGPGRLQTCKWRRKGLKRLISRPEMVGPPEPSTHKIWYERVRGNPLSLSPKGEAISETPSPKLPGKGAAKA